MNRAKTKKFTKTENIIYFIEKGFIWWFVISVLILFILNIFVLTSYGALSVSTVYYFMNTRIQFQWYYTDIELQQVKDPPADCRVGFEKMEIAAWENFQGLTKVDVSNEVSIQDPLKPGKLLNITKTGRKYYRFNVTLSGTDSFPLINRYTLTNWKGTNICVKKLYLDEWLLGMKLIYSNTTCKSQFPNNEAIDCGDYGTYDFGSKSTVIEKYMKLCILYDQIYLDDKATESVSKSKTDPRINEYQNLCPVNNFNFLFTINPKYDTTDINSWEFDYAYYLIKQGEPNKIVNYPLNMIKTEKWASLQGVNPLISTFDMTYFQDKQNYPPPNDTYVFGKTESYTFFPGKPYGLTDLLSQDLDTGYLATLYNDTFFKKRVYDEAKKKYTFEPEFAQNSNSFEYINLNYASAEKYGVTIAKNFLSIFPKKCFENVFAKDPNLSQVLNRLNIQFLEEYTITSFTLCLMLLLLAFYNELMIRYYVIKQILDNTINKYDSNSENYTKLTHKIFEVIICIIYLYYQIYNLNLIDSGINTSKAFSENNCFVINNPPTEAPTEGLKYSTYVNEYFNYYNTELAKFKTIINIGLIILVFQFIYMIAVFVSYYLLPILVKMEAGESAEIVLYIDENEIEPEQVEIELQNKEKIN